MPFKANAARRHHIPKQKRKVTNWAAYNASLRQRGSLDRLVHRGGDRGPGRPRREPPEADRPWYSPLAILTASDAEGGVPAGPAPDRRPDRLHHPPSWSYPGGSDHLHAQPAGETLEVPRPRSGKMLTANPCICWSTARG